MSIKSFMGNRDVVLFCSLITALFLLYLSDAVMLTEMSSKFYRLIDFHLQHHHRYRETTFLLELPSYLALKWTDRMDVLKFLYVWPFLLVPALSLLLSWWFLRKEHGDYFIWPVLGILLGHLHGQQQVSSEQMMVAQLTWPYLIGLFALRGRIKYLWLILASAFLFFTHPISSFSFVLAALFLYFRQAEKSEEEFYPKIMALLMFCLANLRIIAIYDEGYDSVVINEFIHFHEKNVVNILWQVLRSNDYLPLLNLFAPWVLGASIFFKGGATLRAKGTCSIFVLVIFLSYAVPALFMNESINSWTIYFRTSTFLSAPFYLMALHELIKGRKLSSLDSQLRGALIPRIGICYLLALSAFSFRWSQTIKAISEEMEHTSAFTGLSCIPLEALTSLPESFKGYALTPYLFLHKNGARPKNILWFSKECRQFYREGKEGFTDMQRPLGKIRNGFYFDFSSLRKMQPNSYSDLLTGDGKRRGAKTGPASLGIGP